MPDPTPETLYRARHAQLAASLNQAGLSALALNAGPSLTYLTGLHFHLSERPAVVLFIPGEPLTIVLPELEANKTANLSFPARVYTYGEDPHTWGAVFSQAARSAGLDRGPIGVEPRRLRLLELRLLEAAAPRAQFLPAEASLAALRMRKDESEIMAMRRAVAIAQEAFSATLPLIRPGLSERELAAELTVQILRHGSDPELPFFPVVASGPHCANPHAFPGDRRLSPGDALILDWGANFNGYLSDLTRALAIGEPDPELVRIVDIVHAANAAARALAAPGVPAGEVDRAARDVIHAAGYGDYFIHRTGHGLGLESHEEPYIRAGETLRLSPGMTFTIEPAIYLPGRSGVRIEDNVLITESGAESLSSLPRDLFVVAA